MPHPTARLGSQRQPAGHSVPTAVANASGPSHPVLSARVPRVATMDFHASALPLQRRAVGYESALKGYFSRFVTGVDVQVDAFEPEGLDARLELVSVGHLMGAVHASNAPHLLRAGQGAAAHDGLDVYFLSGGQMSFEDEQGTTQLNAGDIA